ncbi:MAG: lytic murein transglycosylase [Solirubrobacterales bacterium]
MKSTSSNRSAIVLVAVICALLGVLYGSFTAYADPTAGSGESPGIVPDGSDNTAPAETTDPGSTAPKKTTAPSTGSGSTGSGSTGGDDSDSSDSAKKKSSSGTRKSTTRAKKRKSSSGDDGLAVDSDGGGGSGGGSNGGGTTTAGDPLDIGGESSSGPISVPNLVLKQFQIPPFLLPIYQAAGTEYGIRWEILASINEIETDYGRNLNVSSAGALGWMQFMPATWEMYGTDANNDGVKDPYNPVDAIFAAARYLKAAGGHDDIERSIFAYNHAQWYVDQVMLRAKLIAGVPDVLIDSLTGLTQGHFPVYARATYTGAVKTGTKRVKSGNAARVVQGSARRNAIKIYSRVNAPAIAVQDSTVEMVGKNKRDGNFMILEDNYGNRYKYANLGSVSKLYPVPRRKGEQSTAEAEAAQARAVADPNKQVGPRVSTKERIYAHPDRERNAGSGAYDATTGQAMSAYETFDNYFARPYGLKKEDVVLKEMKVGSKLIGGTIIGRLGERPNGRTPYLNFQVRPAGSGAPVVDPKPILDGWKLLDSTAVYRAIGMNPLATKGGDRTIGQILLMSKEQLEQFVLRKKSIKIYEGGRADIAAGQIDRRVLAVMAFLDSQGYSPTVTSLISGHGILTSSGNVSEHTTGTALDIAAINGKAMISNNTPGGLMEDVVRKIMTLQGVLEPHQIISLFDIGGATLAMGNHADHIHVGFRPGGSINRNGKVAKGSTGSRISKKDWYRVFDHLGTIENPEVPTQPSAYAIKVNKKVKAKD